ncbi:MAG: hypothetical protein HZB26_08810 [Candidatus Hydrogenedentes bacterium]|nr:hypothetical protein [Candidatus Hydrogenedentota bacterium]
MKRWMSASVVCMLMLVAVACGKDQGGPKTTEDAKERVVNVREQMKQMRQDMVKSRPQQPAPQPSGQGQ